MERESLDDAMLAHWALCMLPQPGVHASPVVLVEARQDPELLACAEVLEAHGATSSVSAAANLGAAAPLADHHHCVGVHGPGAHALPGALRNATLASRRKPVQVLKRTLQRQLQCLRRAHCLPHAHGEGLAVEGPLLVLPLLLLRRLGEPCAMRAGTAAAIRIGIGGGCYSQAYARS